MPTPVTARDNGHSAKSYRNPIGVECEACKRRAPVALDRPLKSWPFKCSACGSREVALWLFAKRDEAGGWIDR